jgi:hypothetical protein
MGKLKTIAKKALKATPPGMMLTAAQKLKEEFGRLTKPKKRPEAKTGPVKKKPKVSNSKGPKKPKVKDPRRPRNAPPRILRDRRNRRKK